MLFSCLTFLFEQLQILISYSFSIFNHLFVVQLGIVFWLTISVLAFAARVTRTIAVGPKPRLTEFLLYQTLVVNASRVRPKLEAKYNAWRYLVAGPSIIENEYAKVCNRACQVEEILGALIFVFPPGQGPTFLHSHAVALASHGVLRETYPADVWRSGQSTLIACHSQRSKLTCLFWKYTVY